MKIIYCGYRGTYAAYVMAAIHTGMYNKDILSCSDVFQRQWEICVKYGEQYGNLMYIGLDENLHEVYALGCRDYYDVINMEYKGMNSIFGIDEKIKFIDCRSWDGHLTHMIARINHHPYVDNISKNLFLYWLKNVYRDCVENVQKEKFIMADEGE